MAGSWGCFENFGGLSVHVLSVAAQLIEKLRVTMKSQKRMLDLSADRAVGGGGVNQECGIFCTQARHRLG